MLLASVGGSGATFTIGLAIATAIVGAIVALVRLPSDRSSTAMTQAQGANEALVEALEAAERQRNYWEHRAEQLEKQVAAWQRAYRELAERAMLAVPPELSDDPPGEGGS